MRIVAVSVIPKEEPAFEVKKVKRPKMPLKKIKVPVDTKKRKPKPRLRKRIVSQKKSFTDIKMPEITGVKGGLGSMGGDGLGSLGFELKMDLFGGDRFSGNELEGIFFDLKQTEDGKLSEIGKLHKKLDYTGLDPFYKAVSGFIRGWKLSRLEDYFQSPKKKYSAFFYVPMDDSRRATEAFGVSETVKPSYWVAYYNGTIAAPENGRYRFVGYGDDVLLVRINKRLVLDAGFEPYKDKLNSRWDSDDDNNRKYPVGRKKDLLYIGDWINMRKGEPLRMEVLIGDVGGECSSHLLIQKQGVEYKQANYSYTVTENGKKVTKTGTRPVLPLFKLQEVPKELRSKMKLNPKEVTLEGPVFGASGASK